MIPDDIADFLRLSIRSVWALELLLLLRKDQARDWTAAALVYEMRASPTIVTGSLAALIGVGLVTEKSEGQVSYRAASPLDPLVARLDALYRKRPVAVTEMIHVASTAKIQTFADSFKLRKD